MGAVRGRKWEDSHGLEFTTGGSGTGVVQVKRRGKSSLTIQFVEGQFVDSYDPTIENTFTKLITVNGQEYHLQLVDTAGQDEYSIFPQTYSIDINGYILVYSVTSIKSFEVIKVIHGKLLDMVGKVQIPIMLVGNKKDLHMERKEGEHCGKFPLDPSTILGKANAEKDSGGTPSRRKSGLCPRLRSGAMSGAAMDPARMGPRPGGQRHAGLARAAACHCSTEPQALSERPLSSGACGPL
ncbi:GTP-binding protein Rheb [Pteropus alecto]|uniref:GTP-binding protein Rheb n=1 Tax=Pteropus alecto TaxID=9402 RepID=L5K0E1_PTEAL|nr:GTP-binding protein Rheb [Pteropus alecto]